MSEWWTYTLSDFLMFSARTYYRLFELYNLAVWPVHLVALAGGAAILVAGWRGRMVAAILVAAWAWVAWAYLLTRYDDINWAARYYALGFAAQALLLAWSGIVRDRLAMRWAEAPSASSESESAPAVHVWSHFLRKTGIHFSGKCCANPASRVGLALFLLAVLAWPLLAPLLGRPWTQAEVFGIAPDPTVMATLGVLLAAGRRNGLLLVIPLLWCVISGATLWTMDSPEAPLLPAVALVTLVAAYWTRAHAVPPP